MNILYFSPGASSAGERRTERGQALSRIAPFGVAITIEGADRGPTSIETFAEEIIAAPNVIRRVAANTDNRYDAIIVGCFGDPGLFGARELSSVPIIGPGEASFALATVVGRKFALIATPHAAARQLDEQVFHSGLQFRSVPSEGIDLSVEEIRRQDETALNSTLTAISRAIERGADTVVLGCMSLGFADLNWNLSERSGVPVINPIRAAVAMAVAVVSCGISHSRIAFPPPPKPIDFS